MVLGYVFVSKVTSHMTDLQTPFIVLTLFLTFRIIKLKLFVLCVFTFTPDGKKILHGQNVKAIQSLFFH